MAKNPKRPYIYSKRNTAHSLAYGVVARSDLKLRVGEFAVLDGCFAFKDIKGRIVEVALKDAAVPLIMQTVEVPNVAHAEVTISNGVVADLGTIGNIVDALDIYIEVPEGQIPNAVIEGVTTGSRLRDSDAVTVYAVRGGTPTKLKKSTYGTSMSNATFQIGVMGSCYTIGAFK